MEFLDDGHNLIVFADKQTGNAIRNLFNEFGADLLPQVTTSFIKRFQECSLVDSGEMPAKERVSMCPTSRKNVVLAKDLFDPALGVVVSKPRDSIVFNGLP